MLLRIMFSFIGIVSICFVDGQDLNGDENNRKGPPKSFWSLGYQHDYGSGPKNGASAAYYIHLGKNRIYYAGLQLEVLSDNKETEELEWIFQAVSLSFAQRVFLNRNKSLSPFVDINVGYHAIRNEAAIPEKLGEKTYWLLFPVREVISGQARKSHTVINKNSLGKVETNITPKYDLGYATYSTKPTYLSVSVGFITGKRRS